MKKILAFALMAMAQGGPVAITYAHRYPGRVTRLVFYDSYADPLHGMTDDDIELEDAEQFESGLRLRDNDTPERELMRQQLEQTVLRAVEELPPELRDAITFREVEGMSYEEIAERMDCPIGTVRSRIFRAREAIDARMKPLLDQDDNARKRSHA